MPWLAVIRQVGCVSASRVAHTGLYATYHHPLCVCLVFLREGRLGQGSVLDQPGPWPGGDIAVVLGQCNCGVEKGKRAAV